jgi:ribosomal protein S4
MVAVDNIEWWLYQNKKESNHKTTNRGSQQRQQQWLRQIGSHKSWQLYHLLCAQQLLEATTKVRYVDVQDISVCKAYP